MQVSTNPAWAKWTLFLAGIYNLAWGTWVVVRPLDLFDYTGISRPTYVGIWQCVGMIVGVYGVGYLAASRDPVRHWPIVLVGFLGKLFGPIGFLQMQWTMSADQPGYLPWSWGVVNIFNDLIWWVPFAGILYLSFRHHALPTGSALQLPLTTATAMQTVRSSQGETLAELSAEQPVLVLFLRHSGCTFCREALADVAQQRERIEAAGTRLAIIHMSAPEAAAKWMAKYGLSDVPQFADPQTRLYRAFGLERGGVRQLFGKAVWWRGFQAAILQRHGVGKMEGDGFQMPGAFLIRDGQIVRAVRHQTAADRLDYAELASV